MSTVHSRRLLGLLGGGLLFLPLIVLAPRGTLRFSVDVQGTATPTPAWMAMPGDLFAGHIALLGYSLPTLEIPVGSETSLRLYWRVSEDSLPQYAVGMRLRSENGVTAWNYADRAATWAAGQMVTEHRSGFPSQVNPGYYDLEICLYDPDTGDVAPVTGPNRTPQGDRVRIAILHLIQGQGDAQVTTVPVRTAVYTAVPVRVPTPRP